MRALLAVAPRLRVVGRLGVGLDNIDHKACAARAIDVIPATGANALAVAEYVIATAMLLLRGAYRATAEIGAGHWPRGALSNGRELAGKTLGLVGYGGIGRFDGSARRARSACGRSASIRRCPRRRRCGRGRHDVHARSPRSLPRPTSLTLHVPLTPATRNLIDASAHRDDEARCDPDQHAHAAASSTKPRSPRRCAPTGSAARRSTCSSTSRSASGSPLAGCPQLILTPHIAGVTRESNERVSALIAESVAEALTGTRGCPDDDDRRSPSCATSRLRALQRAGASERDGAG